MSEAILEMRGLTRSFRVTRGMFSRASLLHAVAGIDLDVMRGEVLGIVGESGCGKSTLARMMLGILPPTAGTMRLGGVDVSEMPRRELARRMQPVFQDPYSSLNPRRRIASIVGLPLDVQGTGSAQERRARALAVMEQVGLPARFADNGRPAPARGDRPRPRHQAGNRDLRRADLGARRVGAEPDPQPVDGSAARPRPHLRVHQP
jgi:peptide/nickel transport system ATP-binding protein